MARPTKRNKDRVQLIDDVLHDILICYEQVFEKDTHLIESYSADEKDQLMQALDCFKDELQQSMKGDDDGKEDNAGGGRGKEKVHAGDAGKPVRLFGA